jgi:hypothetical protein
LTGSRRRRFRAIKFGWDATDGEIAAFADLLLADTQPTTDQVLPSSASSSSSSTAPTRAW